MSITRRVWLLLAVVTVLRLANLAMTELSPDEAYYWLWSERPALSYYSKGPGVAYAIRASTALFGSNEFGVRFWSPLLAAGTSLLMFSLARRMFTEKAAFWTVIALNLTPIFNVGSLVMTIDPLSIFFWAAALLAFWVAIERSPAFSVYWPLTGLLIGLGFLCKFTNAMELLSVALFLLLTPRLRREWMRPGVYSLLAVFAVCTLPPIIWNAERNWITLVHLRERGSLDRVPGVHPAELLAFAGEHFLVYSPLLFAGLVWSIFGNWRRAVHHQKVLYLLCFGLPLVALYALLSVNKAAAPNWTAPAFISLGILAIPYWRERIASRPAVRAWAVAALLLGFAMSVVMVAALETDLLHSVVSRFTRHDPSDRVRGWRSAAVAIEQMREDAEAKLGQKMFMIADERDRAAELSFYLPGRRREGPGHPPVYITESQDVKNQFSFWPRYDGFVEAPAGSASPDGEVYSEERGVEPFIGRSALYVQSGDGQIPARAISGAFVRCDRLGSVQVRRGGRIMRELQVFACYHYRTLPL